MKENDLATLGEDHPVKEFTIVRSKWYRGKGGAYSKLQLDASMGDDGGKRCCLGFFALACGLDEAAIIGVEEPHRIPGFESANSMLPKWLRGNAEIDLINTNDNLYISEREREAHITKKFLKRGVKVNFVDDLSQVEKEVSK